jgi:hypothetical protein
LTVPGLCRAIVDLALDVLGGLESRAKAGAAAILRILTRVPRSTGRRYNERHDARPVVVVVVIVLTMAAMCARIMH